MSRIFAGGDMVPSERTVTVAIGHGKKAARSIDAFLRGTGLAAADKHAPASFGALNTWYYTDAPATVRPQLEAARRIGTFDEVTGGLDDSTALFEARRRMSCGNCFGCDNCYGVCPDNAIVKLCDGQYEVDYDYCKGCGPCAALAATMSDAARIPAIAEAKRRFFEDRFRQAGPVVSGAIVRGEIPVGTDPAELVRALVAPIYLRLLVTAEPVDQATADKAAKAALAAARAGALS